MSELLFGYLANSILRGAVVVGLLWLIELCCRRRLIFAGGRWLYLAALLLILLPFEQLAVLRASTPLPVRHVELPVWSVALPPPEPEEAAPAAEAPDVQTAPSGTASAVSVSPEPSRSVVETKERPGFSGRISNCLFLLYLAGALLLSAKQLRRFFQWRNRVRRCIAITGGRVYDVFLESKRFAKLEHRPVALRDCGRLLPAAACFGTPRRGTVLCPLEEYAALPDAELRMILIHELEHLRRYDNPVAFFLTMVANLLYLNGFVRFLVGRWAAVAELDCDERVRSALRLDRQGEAQYAELLLASQSDGRVALPGCGLGSSARNLKLRIQECFMKRSKRQLFARFAGVTLLFCLGVLLLPELRAGVPREPIPEFVAEHLPADTHTLGFFRTRDLDENGAKLLKKASTSLAINPSLLYFLSFMKATEQNHGIFYMAMPQPPGDVTLLVKNGNDSAEMILSPIHIYKNMTIRALNDGYFLLYPSNAKPAAYGLPEELRMKIAAEPGDILRLVGSNVPYITRLIKRDKSYILSALLPEEVQKDFAKEAVIRRLTASLPEAEKAATSEFISQMLNTSIVKVDGVNAFLLECPISEKMLELTGELLRQLRDEKQAANAPHVVSVEPANGATNVDPNLKEIKVTFDRRMNPTSWSFCQKSDVDFPEFVGRPSYNKEQTVIIVPVRLRPECTYNLYLNSPPYCGFTSEAGGVLKAYHYTFTTGKGRISESAAEQ